MAQAAPKAPGKILGVPTKWAVVIFVVVGVGVWYYLKHRTTSGVATQTQTTPQVAATGTGDSTGGGGSSSTPDTTGPSSTDLLSTLLGSESNFEALAGAVASSPPTTNTYYNAPYNSPTTDTYTYNYAPASPAAPPGSPNTGGTGGAAPVTPPAAETPAAAPVYANNVTPVTAATINTVLPPYANTSTGGIKVTSPTSAHPFFGV